MSTQKQLESKFNEDPDAPPDLSGSNIRNYIVTRFTTLIPSINEMKNSPVPLNPFGPLREVTAPQWNFFCVAMAGWTWDAFDYFAVSLNVSAIAEDLGVSAKDITWGITLVLMLRSVGAVTFGILGDKYGRKWPFIINLALLSVLQIGCGFVNTYKEFLGVRALFGIAMGGVYGNAAATALDDSPTRARGVLSGIMQQGYALGYLLAVVFNRAITDNTSKSWRALFWFSSGPAILICIWRAFMSETRAFQAIKAQEHQSAATSFIAQGKKAMKAYWLMVIYLIILMAGFNFSSHGSQDLYPTMLTKELGYGSDRSTVTNCVANLGAIAGGIILGHLSSFLGRRFVIIIACVGAGAVIYPWAFVHSSSINAGAFFLQFFVQGGWGVVPIHLSELSPHNFRSFIVGTSYQLGNLASSASSTIEATIGERFPLYDDEGNKRSGVYKYSKVMAIFMGCVCGFLLLVTLFGPENRHRDLVGADALMALDDGRNWDDIENKEELENIETVDIENNPPNNNDRYKVSSLNNAEQKV